MLLQVKNSPSFGAIFRAVSINVLALVAGASFTTLASAQAGGPIKIGYRHVGRFLPFENAIDGAGGASPPVL